MGYDIIKIEREIIKKLDEINWLLKSVDLTTLNDTDLQIVEQSISKVWLILLNKKSKQITEK
jgi:hypothetical protein